VETEVSRATVFVNITNLISNRTDVTIRLKGDGYALQPDPIDVALVIDTSGSMTKTDVWPTRMEAAQAATKDFIDNMGLTTGEGDRVALVSFACNASLDLGLVRNPDEIKMVRRWQMAWVTQITTFTSPVIFMVLPIMHLCLGAAGRETVTISQVRIYSIGFVLKLDSTVEGDLGVLSNATGGKYVWAGNETELRNVYTDIAGELKTEAGVDTTMDVIFEDVSVTGVDLPGTDVFDYVYDDGNSTHIHNQTGFEKTINQTSQWNSAQKLQFDIGPSALTWSGRRPSASR